MVVYPRYELSFSRAVLANAVAGVRTATKRFDTDDLPVLAIGYSRGGGLVVEYAAAAPRDGVPVPDAVLGVEPVAQGEETEVTDLRPLRHDTQLVLMIGDKDSLAGVGTRALLRRLQVAGFPAGQITLRFVRSHGSFVADHVAVLGSSASVRAAFWRPADRLLGRLEQGR